MIDPAELADGAAAAEILHLAASEPRRVVPYAGARDHTLHISATGLVTIAGGKWTPPILLPGSTGRHDATMAAIASRPPPAMRVR